MSYCQDAAVDLHSLSTDSNTNTVKSSNSFDGPPLTLTPVMPTPIINWSAVYGNNKQRVLTNPFVLQTCCKGMPRYIHHVSPDVYYPICHRNLTNNTGNINNGHILSIFGNIPASPMHLHLRSRQTICDPTGRYGVYACSTAPLPPPKPSPPLPVLPVLPSFPVLKNLPELELPNGKDKANIKGSKHTETSKPTPETKHVHTANALRKAKKSHKNGAKPFKCSICRKSFRNKSGLSNHKIIHNGLKPHKCTFEQCNKAFGRSCDLTRHIRLHTGDKPFKCKICGKAFTRSVQLRLHVMDHTGKRPYHCGICKKGFKTLQNEQIHMRIHTGEKPYECEFCHKKFTQSSSLRTHLSSIHNP